MEIKRGELLKILGLGVLGFVIFWFYLGFVTYKGDLSGEKILFVKFDGKNGSVQKIENKYLKDSYTIKNSKNLDYGYYKVRFKIKKIVGKGNNKIIEGKILGYKGARLNVVRKYVLNIFDELFITEKNLYFFSRAAILGEKAEGTKDIKDKFKYTGLAHLVVISGTHIGLVIIGIVKLFDMINLHYKLKYILSLVVLSVYCAVVGLSPGVLRAYIMGEMMILARILFEEEDVKKSLNVSLIIILVLNPYAIFDITMQVSYMAVVAIVYVYPPFEKYINFKYLKGMKDGILKDSLKLLLLSFIIQITSLPLFLFYFNKLPLFSFVLNIIGVPLGTVLVEILFVVTLINIIKITFFNGILVLIVNTIYGAFEGFINLGSKIPLLQMSVSKINFIFVVIYYVVLIFIVNILSKKVKNMI